MNKVMKVIKKFLLRILVSGDRIQKIASGFLYTILVGGWYI